MKYNEQRLRYFLGHQLSVVYPGTREGSSEGPRVAQLLTMLCALQDSLEGLFALWLQYGSASKRPWQSIKGQEEKEGSVDRPGSLPAESQVGRGCMPSPDASWLSGGHPLRNSRSDASSSLWPSGHSLAHPRGLEMSWLSNASPSLVGFLSSCPPTAL